MHTFQLSGTCKHGLFLSLCKAYPNEVEEWGKQWPPKYPPIPPMLEYVKCRLKIMP